MKKLAIVLTIVAAVIVAAWFGTFSLRRSKAEDYFEAGNKYLAERNDSQAILEYKKGAFLYSTADIYFALGQAYFLNQNFSRAGNYFKKALTKDEKHAKSIFGLSEVYLYQEKPDEARDFLESKNLDDTLLNIELARIYIALEEDEKAEKLIEEETDNLSKFYQAKILLLQEQYKEVARKLSQVEAKENDERTILLKEPTILEIKAISDAASQSLKTTNSASRKVILGEALNQSTDAVIAIPILKKVTEKNATYRDAFLFLGHAYILAKLFEPAKETLIKAVDLDSIHYPSWLYLGTAYEGLGNEEVANNCYKKAEELKDK